MQRLFIFILFASLAGSDPVPDPVGLCSSQRFPGRLVRILFPVSSAVNISAVLSFIIWGLLYRVNAIFIILVCFWCVFGAFSACKHIATAPRSVRLSVSEAVQRLPFPDPVASFSRSEALAVPDPVPDLSALPLLICLYLRYMLLVLFI